MKNEKWDFMADSFLPALYLSLKLGTANLKLPALEASQTSFLKRPVMLR